MKLLKYLLSITVLSICVYACSQNINSANNNSPDTEPIVLGIIKNKKLREVSGMTPCMTSDGLWWVTNDSGDKAKLYLVKSDGTLDSTFTVLNAKNRDWEDLAGYEDKKGNRWLYIADIGNNSGKRTELTIYKVKEPVRTKKIGGNETSKAEPLPFKYPDGNFDAEAIFVDPTSGRPYVITKSMALMGGVYRFPLPLTPGKQTTLEKVEGEAAGKFSRMFMVTGAAISPDGNRIIVRNYTTAWEITRPEGSPNFEDIFNSEAKEVTLPDQKQGEVITYALDGKSIVVTSEKTPATIYKIIRK